MRKTINLADRTAAMEALKKLYGNEEVKDDRATIDTNRESGTESISSMGENATKV